jgi:alkylhydroperoxidase/carboxymuconolactone decarboxylase family protein YurZ
MEASEFKVAESLAATGANEALTDREKHMIGLSVALTRGCQFCSGGRMEKALESGIPYEAIQATVDLTAAVNAGVVLRTAIQGADINKIDEVCDGPECSIGTPE